MAQFTTALRLAREYGNRSDEIVTNARDRNVNDINDMVDVC